MKVWLTADDVRGAGPAPDLQHPGWGVLADARKPHPQISDPLRAKAAAPEPAASGKLPTVPEEGRSERNKEQFLRSMRAQKKERATLRGRRARRRNSKR